MTTLSSTDRAVKAYNDFQAGFLRVLYVLQECGVKVNQGEGPAALGITTEEFNKHSLATAGALWKKGMQMKAVLSGKDAHAVNGDTFEVLEQYMMTFSNVHEILEDMKIATSFDSNFTVLGIDKAAFEMESQLAAQTGLQLAPEYAKNGGTDISWLSKMITECIKCSGLDPSEDLPYQGAGYASKAAFDTELSGWIADAKEKFHQRGGCCHGSDIAPNHP